MKEIIAFAVTEGIELAWGYGETPDARLHDARVRARRPSETPYATGWTERALVPARYLTVDRGELREMTPKEKKAVDQPAEQEDLRLQLGTTLARLAVAKHLSETTATLEEEIRVLTARIRGSEEAP